MAVGLEVFVEPLPDGVWVDSVLEQDAFDRLYRQCHGDLVALCRRLLCGRGDAEAVAQEAFVRAWTSLDRFSPSRPFWPWLATIARRLCIDHRRRLARELQHVDLGAVSATDSSEPSPEEALEAHEEYRSACEALRRLKPSEQRVIALRDLNGWSYEEIADFEGVTIESVRGALKRARTSLRRSYASVSGAAPAVVGVGCLARLRRRIDPLLARPSLTAGTHFDVLSMVNDIVVRVAVVATALVAGAAPSTPLAGEDTRPTAVAFRPSAHAEPAVAPELRGSHRDPVPSPPKRSPGDAPMAPISPRDLVPPLFADEADAPEDAWVESISSDGDSTIFASGTVRNCARPPCPALFRSHDGGASWTRLAATGFVGGEVILPPRFPEDDRVFVAGPAGLQVSRDGASSFATATPISGPAAMSPVVTEWGARILIVGAQAWEYRDASGTATPAALAFGPAVTPGDVAFAPGADGKRVLVGATAVDTTGRQRASVFVCESALCGPAAFLGDALGAPSLAVSPRYAEDGVVLAWRGSRLFGSRDGGTAFRPISLPGSGAIRGVAFTPSGGVLVALATPRGGSGLLQSSDGGESWSPVGAGTPVAGGVEAVAVLGDGRLVAAPVFEAGGGLVCSVDGGRSWRPRCP